MSPALIDQVDVVVVGGGAAGIAAARTLAAKEHSVLIVETLPRLGGRAHTKTIDGLNLDLGCGWMHSADRNSLADLAAATDETIDRREAAWRKQYHHLGAPREDQRHAWKAYTRFRERLHASPPASDRAADALAPGDPWRGFIDGLSSFINGAELDTLSVRDFLAYEDASDESNWRLPNGYGAFIASMGAGLPAALATRVTSIMHDRDVVVETDRGLIRAKAAIVTVSTAALAGGAIRFNPAVDRHLTAAACLPLGLADKIFLSVAEPEAVPEESHLLGRFDRAATGSYYMRPLGMPVIECFIGGAFARTLEHQSDADAAAFAIDELRSLLGAEFARGLKLLARTRWGREPTIGGSYSHALPGHAEARAKLAEPVNERLCFAGEACSASDFSTAHGAWDSGLAAADWVTHSL